MPIRRPPIINREIYHIVVRAVDSTQLFKDKKDYLRMIHDLFIFNNNSPTPVNYRVQNYRDVTRTVLDTFKRRLVVDIMAFCLMPNHVHLLVRQLKDGGISKFMRKIGAGYGGYYNKKYKRSGHLFQGKYKIVHIQDDKQLITIFVYIHTNPVAILVPSWKEKGIKGIELQKVIKFVEGYRWSSYSDYSGKKNFPSVTSREFLLEAVGGIKEGRRFVNDWLQFKKELADYKQIAIE